MNDESGAGPRAASGGKGVKLALATSILLFTLSLGMLALARRQVDTGGMHTQEVLDDPRARAEVVERLVDRVPGSYDSHNDPQVGRVLMPRLKNRSHGGILIDTNRFGIRERDYELPKPEGLVRVVLLGDSYVFGTRSEAEDRMGALLERWLRERSGRDGVEVLHLGILSWNALAECAYVRRQMALLRPDLVIHITTANDLDDVEGVRGFGGLARFTPQFRDRADGAIHVGHPTLGMGFPSGANFLVWGHDAESLGRWDRCGDEVGRLVRAIEGVGGKYVHVFRWPGLSALARARLGRELEEDQVIYLSQEFMKDESTWVEPPGDSHWNPLGMGRMARLFYGVIQQRDLLPALELPPWPEADEEVERIHETGRAEQPEGEPWSPDLGNAIDFETLAFEDAQHVYGGVDGAGLMGPFASMSLANRGGGRLRVRATCLPRPEIDGARVRVSVDGILVGEVEVEASREVDEVWRLPEEVSGRKYVNVRFEADDYAYAGDDLQQCVVWKLRSLAIVNLAGARSSDGR